MLPQEIQDSQQLFLDTCKKVKAVVAVYFKLPPEAFLSRSRKSEIVHAKHLAMLFVREMAPKAFLKDIGEQFGFTHATVIYSLKTIKGYLSYDNKTKKEYLDIHGYLSTGKQEVINLNNCFSIHYNGGWIIFAGIDKQNLPDIFKNVDLKEHIGTKQFIVC